MISESFGFFIIKITYVCFSDKFFSKTRLDSEKSIEKALKSISKYGEDGIIRFNNWCERFL